MQTPADLSENFNKVYGKSPFSICFAPARVNIIGEHTDYNGGYVLPCALDNFGIFVAIATNENNLIRFHSLDFNETIEVSLEQSITPLPDQSWANYPLGVLDEFLKIKKHLKRNLTGLDFLITGNIPQGTGLSSSAALELATAFAINEVCKTEFSLMELVKLSQQAENNFVGVNCGIMDQFAVAHGKKDAAILLKCDSLEWKHFPLILDGYQLIIANTNYPRKLSDSKYNERRSECEEAVNILKQKYNIDYLGELDIALAHEALALIHDPIIHKRAKHFFEENHRVMVSRVALKNDDLAVLGKLMNNSHSSLRDNYEVTGLHLDTLVAAAQAVKGTLGARMTGAGFGGCTVNLVKSTIANQFKEEVGAAYQAKTGLDATFYDVTVGDGVKKVG